MRNLDPAVLEAYRLGYEAGRNSEVSKPADDARFSAFTDSHGVYWVYDAVEDEAYCWYNTINMWSNSPQDGVFVEKCGFNKGRISLDEFYSKNPEAMFTIFPSCEDECL